MLGLQAQKGVKLQGTVIDMNLAGVANAFTIFQLSNAAQQMGTKTFRIKKILGYNDAGVNTLIHIGTGVAGAFVASIAPLLTIAGIDFEFTRDLLEVEWSADMTAYPDNANVYIQVEVEEIG